MSIDKKLSGHRSEISYRTGSSDIAGDLRIVTEGMWSHDGEKYYEPNYSCEEVALNHFGKGSNKSLQKAYNKASRQHGKQLIAQELAFEYADDQEELEYQEYLEDMREYWDNQEYNEVSDWVEYNNLYNQKEFVVGIVVAA